MYLLVYTQGVYLLVYTQGVYLSHTPGCVPLSYPRVGTPLIPQGGYTSHTHGGYTSHTRFTVGLVTLCAGFNGIMACFFSFVVKVE